MRSLKRSAFMPNARQQKLAKALCEGKKPDKAMSTCGVSKKTFRAWMDDPAFAEAIRYEQHLQMQEVQRLICRNVSTAANQLIALAESDKGETARKACLDILELARQHTRDREPTVRGGKAPRLSPEEAERVLEALDA